MRQLRGHQLYPWAWVAGSQELQESKPFPSPAQRPPSVPSPSTAQRPPSLLSLSLKDQGLHFPVWKGSGPRHRRPPPAPPSAHWQRPQRRNPWLPHSCSQGYLSGYLVSRPLMAKVMPPGPDPHFHVRLIRPPSFRGCLSGCLASRPSSHRYLRPVAWSRLQP